MLEKNQTNKKNQSYSKSFIPKIKTSMKNLKVMFDNLMIEQIKEEGIIARPKEDIVTRGRVTHMGTGYVAQHDRFLPPQFKEGDIVYFQPHTAYKIKE